MIKRVGVDSIDFTEDLVGVVIPCNISIHPTGYPGDESCGYSECESGGSFSAICGCVDLGTRGDTGMSVGMQWICMHSTCGCSFIDEGTFCNTFNFVCFFIALVRNVIRNLFLNLNSVSTK